MMNKVEIINLLKRKDIPGEYLHSMINYFLHKNNLSPYFMYYKIIIKDIGCNAKCPICDDWKRTGNIKEIRINLFKALKEILNEKVHKKQLQILGGEPILIFEDLLKIINICKNNKIKVDFPTNASLLNIEKIDKLIKVGLDSFTFSIDFPTDKHDKWRNLKGAFDKIILFTNYLKNKNIKVQWNSVIGKFNYKYIKDFENLYSKSFPSIHNFIYIENNGGSSQNNILKNDEKKEVIDILKSFKNKNIILNGFEIENKNVAKSRNCFLVLKNKTFFIDDKKITYSLCHYKGGIKDLEKFKNTAIYKGCNKCDSSCKNTFNNYFTELIKNIDI